MKFYFITWLLLVSSTGLLKVVGCLSAELIAGYFSRPGLEVGAIVLITCSAYDELKLLKQISAWNLSFYSGRGKVNETYEIDGEAFTDPRRRLGVFVDFDCDCARRTMMQVDGLHFLSEMVSWLFWSTVVKPEQLEWLQLKLQHYSEVKFALQNEADVKIYDVYRIKERMPVIATLIATWNASNELIWHSDTFFDKYNRRLDLRGAILQGGIALADFDMSDPDLFDHLSDHNRNKSRDTPTRVIYMLSKVLQEIHNFSLNVTITDTVGYTKKSDGSYEGLHGLFQTEKIDMGMSGLTMFPHRLSLMEFSTLPVWQFRSCFFFLQPRFLERSTFLIYPLRAVVWLASFLIILVASACISIVAIYDLTMKMSASIVLVHISAIFSQQGAGVTSEWISGRLLLFFSLIFGFMLLNYYSGQMVSEILNPPPIMISTPKQLLDSQFLLAADVVPPFLKFRYKSEKSNYFPEIGSKVEKTGGYMHLEEGLENVKNSYYAFETEDSKGYDVIDKTYSLAEICAVGEVAVLPIKCYFTFRRHSSFREIFSISLLIMKERGIIKRLTSPWRYPKPQCVGSINILPVDLENISIAFYILFSGIALAGFIFLIEYFVSKRGLGQQQRVRPMLR